MNNTDGFHIESAEPAEYTDEILALWKPNLGDRFPLDARLLRQQLELERDDKILFVARASSKLVGAALVKRRRRPDPDGTVPAIGNLSFLLVDQTSRRRGIGTALLSEAEAWLKAGGARLLHIGRDRYHLFPGAPEDGSEASLALAAFLRARGFTLANEESDLRADLGGVDLAALEKRAPMPQGWRFALYEPRFRPSLEAFYKRNFPGRWFDDCMEALEAGMRGEDLGLLVEEGSGAVEGFCRLYDGGSPVLGPGLYWRGLMGASPCGLGPIGVDASRRGLGLGLALLRAGLAELAGRGCRTCVIDWTDLGDFYAKMGFSVWKRYRMASKEISWA